MGQLDSTCRAPPRWSPRGSGATRRVCGKSKFEKPEFSVYKGSTVETSRAAVAAAAAAAAAAELRLKLWVNWMKLQSYGSSYASTGCN